jgi:hypothetical protein
MLFAYPLLNTTVPKIILEALTMIKQFMLSGHEKIPDKYRFQAVSFHIFSILSFTIILLLDI